MTRTQTTASAKVRAGCLGAGISATAGFLAGLASGDTALTVAGFIAGLAALAVATGAR